MRSAIQEVKHLTDNDKLILISGDEPLLIHQATDYLRKKIRHHSEATEIVSVTIDSIDDLNELKLQADTPSLFSQEQCFFVYLNFSINAQRGKALNALISELPINKRYIFITFNLSKQQLSAAWVKSLEKKGKHYIAYKIKSYEYIHWIKKQMKRHHLRTSEKGYQYIAHFNENNALECYQSIEKLVLLYGKGEVSEDQILSTLAEQSNYTVFQLVDSCLLADYSRMNDIFYSLQSQKEEPSLILALIVKELRLLTKLAFSENVVKTLAELGVWQSKQQIYMTTLKRLTKKQLLNLIHMAKNTDAVIKGVAVGDPWNYLKRLCESLVLAIPNGNQTARFEC